MRAFPLFILSFALFNLNLSLAVAQDAVRGKQLYHDVGRLRGGGVSCVDCHGGFPGAVHGIGKAAGNPDAIAYAVEAISQMTPLRGNLSTEDMADLAAYLAFPAVPTPDPRLSAFGPAASPYSAERLEFPEAYSGSSSPPTTLRLTNAGGRHLKLLSAPALDGDAAGQFAVTSTDCIAGAILAPQRFCTVEIVFNPQGEPGVRTAKIGLLHDWIRGGVNVALIGRVVRSGLAPVSIQPYRRGQRR